MLDGLDIVVLLSAFKALDCREAMTGNGANLPSFGFCGLQRGLHGRGAFA